MTSKQLFSGQVRFRVHIQVKSHDITNSKTWIQTRICGRTWKFLFPHTANETWQNSSSFAKNNGSKNVVARCAIWYRPVHIQPKPLLLPVVSLLSAELYGPNTCTCNLFFCLLISTNLGDFVKICFHFEFNVFSVHCWWILTQALYMLYKCIFRKNHWPLGIQEQMCRNLCFYRPNLKCLPSF